MTKSKTRASSSSKMVWQSLTTYAILGIVEKQHQPQGLIDPRRTWLFLLGAPRGFQFPSKCPTPICRLSARVKQGQHRQSRGCNSSLKNTSQRTANNLCLKSKIHGNRSVRRPTNNFNLWKNTRTWKLSRWLTTQPARTTASSQMLRCLALWSIATHLTQSLSCLNPWVKAN